MGQQTTGSGQSTRSATSLLAATRRLGAVVLTILCLGAASVPSAEVASANVLAPAGTVRVIITANSVGTAQALVLSVLGRVVTTLPIVNGVVADVNSSLLPPLGGVLSLAGVTVTPDVPVDVGTGPTSSPVNL